VSTIRGMTETLTEHLKLLVRVFSTSSVIV
jgi:hypothetical protein